MQKKLAKGERASAPAPTRYKNQECSASQVISKRDVRAEASGTNNNKDIRIENFDISFGEKVLLKSADVLLVYGRR